MKFVIKWNNAYENIQKLYMAIIMLDTIMYIMITNNSAFKVDSMLNNWMIWIDQLIQQNQQNIPNVDTA